MKSALTIAALALKLSAMFVSADAQNISKVDSLLALLKKDKPDTVRVNHLSELTNEYRLTGQFDSSLYYGELSMKLSQKLNYKSGIAAAYCNMGLVYLNYGEYSKALDYFLKDLKISEETGNKTGKANVLGNIGLVYYNQSDFTNALEYFSKAIKAYEELGDNYNLACQLSNSGNVYADRGDYSLALEYYFKALRVADKVGNKYLLSNTLGNIGTIYKDMKESAKAMDYTFRALKVDEELKNRSGIARHYGNIAGIYEDQNKPAEALDYYLRALKLDEELGNQFNVSVWLLNIGHLHEVKNDFKSALEYNFRALKIAEQIGFRNAIAVLMGNIGSVYTKTGKYSEAEAYLKRSIAMNDSIGAMDYVRQAEEMLSILYERTGRFADALDHYRIAMAIKDTLFNQLKNEEITRKEMTYEFEKKEAIQKAEQEKKQAVAEAEKRRQQVILYSVIGGFIILLIFAVFIFRSLRITRRQKNVIFEQKVLVDEKNILLNQQNEEIRSQRDEIETQRDEIIVQRDLVTHQKEHIEEMHKELTDSINYAERIQRSFLATKNLLDENLNDYFIVFKPRDVVSGDFYWAGKLSNGNFALLAGDSTGHGVPGAIMSILNISSLEKAVEQGLNDPSEILNFTRIAIIERLKKDGSPEGGKDGMDACLLCFDLKSYKLVYAAANNPVWVIRGNEMIELAPNQMPVGKHEKDQTSFARRDFQLQKGDTIYIATDGYEDQFGGPKGKKFMGKKFRQLLTDNCNRPMNEQQNILDNTIEEWKNGFSEKYEQTDDITVIGIRIS